jgi:hypothetical protein
MDVLSWNQLTIDGYVHDEWLEASNNRSNYVDTTLVDGSNGKNIF